MVFLPVQAIDPVVQVFVQTTVQADLKKKEINPFQQIRRVITYCKGKGRFGKLTFHNPNAVRREVGSLTYNGRAVINANIGTSF